MLNKSKRLIRKYPILSALVVAAGLALALEAADLGTLARWLLFVASATAVVPALLAMNRTLKHGFYGINLLPVTGLVFALLLKQYWAALVLALILSTDKPLLAYLQRRHRTADAAGRPASFTTVSHAPFVRLLDRYSLPFTVLILLIAGALWVITGEVQRFLETIAAASTAPLLLAAPIALLSDMNRTRQNGTSIRSASAFERLAGVKTVIISKGGILTSEEVRVHEIKAYGGHTKTNVLRVAGALAGQSEHPLAQAIAAAAGENAKGGKAKHAREVSGMGISGRLRGQSLHIGRLSFLEQAGVSLPAKLTEPDETVVYVAQNEALIGSISFNETLLPGVKTLVKRLKRLGIGSVQVVSGSTAKSLAAIAKQAGIATYLGDYTAADKIKAVEESERPAAFIGDIRSDAAALTAADVSLAYGEPADGLPDIAISDRNIGKLVEAFSLSKQSLRRAWLASVGGLSMTLTVIVAASSGVFSALQAAGLQALTLVLTVFIASGAKKSKNN